MNPQQAQEFQSLTLTSFNGQLDQFVIPAQFFPGAVNIKEAWAGNSIANAAQVIETFPQDLNAFNEHRGALAKKRIAVFTDDPGWGGVYTHTYTLVEHLAHQGYSVMLCMTLPPPEHMIDLVELNVHLFDIGYNTVDQFPRTLTDDNFVNEILAQFSPQVLVFEDSCPVSFLGAREAAIASGRTVISIEHLVEPYLADKFEPQLPQLSHIYDQCKDVIAISQYGMDMLCQHFGLNRDKGLLIPNGVDEYFFIPLHPSEVDQRRTDLNIPPQAKVITTVCRLSPEKQVDKLIKSFEILVKERMPTEEIHLVIVGDGPQRRALEELVRNLNIAQRVHFRGHTAHVKGELAYTNLFLLLSRQEGLPMALLEAIAYGVPVMAHDVGGIKELLGADSAYLLAPDITTGEVATLIRNFFQQDALTQFNVSRSQQAKVIESHLADDMLEEYEQYITDDGETPDQLRDYVSPNLTNVDMRLYFDRLAQGKPHSAWPYLRSHIPHKMYYDSRYPGVGTLNMDEVTLLYNIALQFPNRKGLEIGCWFGFTTLHILEVNGLYLDIVDPLLAIDAPQGTAWRQDLERLCSLSVDRRERTTLYGMTSHEFYENVKTKRYDFVMIDGNHEAGGPLLDAQQVAKIASERCCVVFHDLVSPHVFEGFKYLVDQGWRYRVYMTQQIMGACWRGSVDIPHHIPDPHVAWDVPAHIQPYFSMDAVLSGVEHWAINSMAQSQVYTPPEMEPEIQIHDDDPDHNNIEFESLYGQIKAHMGDDALVPKQRMQAIYWNVRRICEEDIPGDLIECGVYKGGTAALIYGTMIAHSKHPRRLFLLDTFEGMPEPKPIDVTFEGKSGHEALGGKGDLAAQPQEVVANLDAIIGIQEAYPVGLYCMDVRTGLETFLEAQIERIAFLHSDTDFAESSGATVDFTAPYLSKHAIVQVDDYHHWHGCKVVIDKWLSMNPHLILQEVPDVGGVYWRWQKPPVNTAIALIAYNRPEHTAKLCEIIADVNPRIVYACIDNADGGEDRILQNEVIEVIKDILEDETDVIWNITREHLGSRVHIPKTLDTIFELEPQAIILEDDCHPDPSFFPYMETMLNLHRDNPSIWHISGNNFNLEKDCPAIVLSRFPHCWGWGTWDNRWQAAKVSTYRPDLTTTDYQAIVHRCFGQVSVEGEQQFIPYWVTKFMDVMSQDVPNWDYLWQLRIWQEEGLCIHPHINLVHNVGLEDGQHVPSNPVFKNLFAGRASAKYSGEQEGAFLNATLSYAQHSIRSDLFIQMTIFEQDYDSPVFIQSFYAMQGHALTELNRIWALSTFEDGENMKYVNCQGGLMTTMEMLIDVNRTTPTPILSQLVLNLNMVPAYFVDNPIPLFKQRAELMKLMVQSWGLPLEWEMDPKTDQTIRYGVLLESLGEQTEGYANLPWIKINNKGVEVYLIRVYDSNNEIMDIARNICKRQIILCGDGDIPEFTPEYLTPFLEQAIAAIRSLNLDALYFGTNLTAVTNISALLAQCRLARYQIISHNCPYSPWFSEIDGYYTSSNLVGEDWQKTKIQQQFGEKLMVHGGPAQVFHMPKVHFTSQYGDIINQFDDSEEMFILVSGANYFKYNEVLLEVYMEILQQCPTARLFLYPFNQNWYNQYPIDHFCKSVEIMAQSYGLDPKRIAILKKPFSTRQELLQFIRGGLLYLDSYPYTGMTSLLDPMELEMPILTVEGSKICSRMGASMLRSAGLGDLVCKTKDEYVATAVKWIQWFEATDEERDKWSALADRFSNQLPEVFTGTMQMMQFSARLGGAIADVIRPLIQDAE